MPSMKHSHLLARVNFPLYTIQCLNERFILVAGGGGASKTGIRNVIEVYQLVNKGKICSAELVKHYETGSEAVMNCAVLRAGECHTLFTGKEGNCQVYEFREIGEENKDVTKNLDDEFTSSRNLKTESYCGDVISEAKECKLSFEVKPLESFQTDFSEEPFQKLVKFSTLENLLATGGTDGHIRLWALPKLNQIIDIKPYNDDVVDMDFCPMGKKLVSVSRDGHGRVWNTHDGSLITDLECFPTAKSNAHYIFRNCRFAVLGNKNDLALYTTLNPAMRKKNSVVCYLCKYETKTFTVEKSISTGTDMLSAMAVSDDGRFIGLGCQSGSIVMYAAFNLQLLYNVKNIHGIFVTCVQFLPTTEASRQITGGHDASLISVSVDNRIIIHHIPMRMSVSILTPITFLILTLFFVFVIADFNL